MISKDIAMRPQNNESGKAQLTIILILLVILLGGALAWVITTPSVIKGGSTAIMIKEILPVAEYASLSYKYEIVSRRPDTLRKVIKAPDLLLVYKGTIKLGFNFADIDPEEEENQLILNMPPIKVLSHEIHLDSAKSHEVRSANPGIYSHLARQTQDVLDLLGSEKLMKEKSIEKDEETKQKARESAEYYLRQWLGKFSAVNERYDVERDIVFIWPDKPAPRVNIRAEAPQ